MAVTSVESTRVLSLSENRNGCICLEKWRRFSGYVGSPDLEGRLLATFCHRDQFLLFLSLNLVVRMSCYPFLHIFSSQKGVGGLIFFFFFFLFVSGFLFRFYGLIAKGESVGYCCFPKFYFVCGICSPLSFLSLIHILLHVLYYPKEIPFFL